MCKWVLFSIIKNILLLEKWIGSGNGNFSGLKPRRERKLCFYEIINDHPAEDPALICQDKMLTYGEVREEVAMGGASAEQATAYVKAIKSACSAKTAMNL